MQSHILASRAICSVYIFEIVRPLVLSISVACFAAAGLVAYLAARLSPWWLVFIVPIGLALVLLTLVSTLVFSIARTVAPPMTPAQRQAAQEYIQNMHDVSGGLQTPKFVIIIKIILDLLKRRWQGGFIQQTATKSVRLKQDFAALATSFAH